MQTLNIDIDERNGLKYLSKVRFYLGYPDIIMLEQSIEGKIHVIFAANRVLNDIILKEIEKSLRKHVSKKIDVRTSKRAMRLPGSHSYKTGYLNNNDEFIPLNKVL